MTKVHKYHNPDDQSPEIDLNDHIRK